MFTTQIDSKMTVKDFNKALTKTTINTSALKQIEKVYGTIDSQIVRKILSFGFKKYFFESDGTLRALSLNEILDAKESLHVNFPQQRVLPLFDTGDNDFIVYHIDKNKWSMMNINDLSVFLETDNLWSLLK